MPLNTRILSKTRILSTVLLFTRFNSSNSKSLTLKTVLCGYGKTSQHKTPRDICLNSGQVKNFGEDAGFFTPEKIIIADGVGGWRRQGVDPSHYSYEITRFLAENVDSTYLEKLDLLHHVEANFENIKNLGIRGSTTLLYAVLESKPDSTTLNVYNLGDCMLVIIRNKKVIYSSGTQQAKFNFPYQLSSHGNFKPSQATIDKIELENGDLIVSGSDGFWDNVFEEEIVEFLENGTVDLSMSSWDLTDFLDLVSKRSDDEKYCSPFCKNAREVAGKHWLGGKVDDTTLGVSRVEFLDVDESVKKTEL